MSALPRPFTALAAHRLNRQLAAFGIAVLVGWAATGPMPAGAQSAAALAAAAGNAVMARPQTEGGTPGTGAGAIELGTTPTNPLALPPGATRVTPIPEGTGPTAPGARIPLPPLETTQFQRFVRESTGQNLRLHGFELFDTARLPSVVDVPAPGNYVVGPGDELDIKIWGAADLNLRVAVDRNGQITLPKMGPLTVAGVKVEDLDRTLRQHVGRVLSNFEVSATLGRVRTVQVFVVGQARKPGAYLVSSLSTLIGALFDSGGPASTGSLRQIQVVRANRTVSTLDLYRFMHEGNTQADIRLQAGDVIVIPPAGPRVALTGALDKPGIYELAPGETLEQVLRFSGGTPRLSSPHKVLLERLNLAQRNAPRTVEERALDAPGLATRLADGDLVTLLPMTPAFSNAVTLRGNVAQPLRHAYKPGMRVSDLIPEPAALIDRGYWLGQNRLVQFSTKTSTEAAERERDRERDRAAGAGNAGTAEGPLGRTPGQSDRASTGVADSAQAITEARKVSRDEFLNQVKTALVEINWEYAAIERLDMRELRTVLIPFNLRQAVVARDPAQNLELQPGDVVTIFGVDTLETPTQTRSKYVRVAGEVRAPGIYAITPGDTLESVVRRAGGLTGDAYLYGSVFTRESTRTQQQDNLDRTIRRIQSEAASNAQALAQSRAAEGADRAALVEAQRRSQAALVERLQSLKASGRVALDIDPQSPALPPLTLEDGDSLLVPVRPSFVSVFGAVLAESSFVHRSGMTVADALTRAGATRDADLGNVLVIRADGSVQGNSSGAGSWISSGVSGSRLQPGDSVFVPELLDKRSPSDKFWQNAKDFTQLLYQLGLGAAAIKTLRN